MFKWNRLTPFPPLLLNLSLGPRCLPLLELSSLISPSIFLDESFLASLLNNADTTSTGSFEINSSAAKSLNAVVLSSFIKVVISSISFSCLTAITFSIVGIFLFLIVAFENLIMS